jgi:sulfopropanediol 3-dehydrogenase
MKYLKKRVDAPEVSDTKTEGIVKEMLGKLEAGREVQAQEYSLKLDNFTGNAVLTSEQIQQAVDAVPGQVKKDILFAKTRVEKFARAQLASIQEFEIEVSPGTWCGQKIIPITTVGCYVPGGRYSHVASAIMSIATAKVAGVTNVIACTAPHSGDEGPNNEIIYAMHICGADKILACGGVQGIASLAFGLFTDMPADMIAGPGNRFVAEAKRLLFGRVGIDMFAGPTEIGIIADDSADAEIVAEDLCSQGEHGPDSPCWLFTDSERVAAAVLARIDGHILSLPEPAKTAAMCAWRDYGEVILCDSKESLCAVSDRYAPEHLELHTADNAWYTANLKSYGSLFIGEETTVTYGDKCSGTNHCLPTKQAARYVFCSIVLSLSISSSHA